MCVIVYDLYGVQGVTLEELLTALTLGETKGSGSSSAKQDGGGGGGGEDEGEVSGYSKPVVNGYCLIVGLQM